MSRGVWIYSLVLASFALPAFLAAAESHPGFELIQQNCLACHGDAQMSGLDLRTRSGALNGGSRGPAIVPGNAGESLLMTSVRRVGDLKMPPGKAGLSEEDVAALAKWIDEGAPWPEGATAESAENLWWSFRKPEKPAVPEVQHGSRVANPIDAFVFAKLEEHKLQPTELADRRTLARRVYFDMLGLPPSPEEIDAFVNDPAPDAYGKLVDKLLDSPRYGERWGRHWLDVVRYADTAGFETDALLANAWRYRDYVIDSFQNDKPYDVFVQEQIAADEIWPDNLDLNGTYGLPDDKKASLNKRIGTSLYSLGAFPVEITFYGDYYRSEWAAEAVDMTGSAFLGLTVGCARCHDHKFDPIKQKDYYSLTAFFSGSEEREVPIVDRMTIYEYTRHETLWVAAEQLAAKIRRIDERASGEQRELTPAERDERTTLLAELGKAYMRAPKPVDKANLLVHTENVPPTYVLNRGDWQNKGPEVKPSFPAALHDGKPIVEPKDHFIPQRRKALAEWMTSKDNPLFARVMVNRLWQWHFGEGIVATPNDFGRQGALPSDPELLDWLATEFVDNGYSVKQMHRLILTSDTYRRSSKAVEANDRIDPENRYLWRMNRKRLEAEAVRDAMLSVSGEINLKAGGPPVTIPLSDEEMLGMRSAAEWPVNSDPADYNRRSVYLFVKRSFQLPMLQIFDAPEPTLSCSRRDESTVAPQALALMNSSATMEQATAFAASLREDHGDDSASLVNAAWLRALGRAPDDAERSQAVAFLDGQGLDRLCLLLFNLNEFIYVD
jgi:cytochrome c553